MPDRESVAYQRKCGMIEKVLDVRHMLHILKKNCREGIAQQTKCCTVDKVLHNRESVAQLEKVLHSVEDTAQQRECCRI